MGITEDRNHPKLGHGVDSTPRDQNEVYLVLPEADRAKGYLMPYEDTYKHLTCGGTTTMGASIAATYAADPWFYGSTYCVHCRKHCALEEFVWNGTNISMCPAWWSVELMERVAKAKADRAAGIKLKVVDPSTLVRRIYPVAVAMDGTTVTYTYEDGHEERQSVPSRRVPV